MLIADPVRESYEEIRNKYDGYCVLVIECASKKPNFESGKAIAFDKSLASLITGTRNLINDDIGTFIYSTFTDFGNFSPIQVTHHE